MVPKAIKAVDKAAEKFGYWWPVCGLLVAGMTWLVTEISSVSQYGWAAVAFVGIMSSAFIIFSMGVLLLGTAKVLSLSADRSASAGEMITQVNTEQKALEILLPNDRLHFRTNVGPNEQVRKTIFLEMRNIGNGFLTECHLSIESVSPTPKNGPVGFALFNGAMILQGQRKFIDLVGFNEIPTKSEHGWDLSYNNFLTVFPVLCSTRHHGGAASIRPDHHLKGR